jgi:hypothetical protein
MNINELITAIMSATTGPELRRAIINALVAVNSQ